MSRSRPQRSFAVFVTVLVSLALLAACSGGSDAGSPTPSAATPTSATPSGTSSANASVARIGVLTSDKGLLESTGQGVRDSVELAVREANLAGDVPGWTVEVVAANDASSQSAGQQAASGLAANPSVIGAVGTLASTIDEGVQPILNDAGIAMISPAGTTAQLTRRLDKDTVVRPFPTYFRLSPTDADQGPAAAQYAAKVLDVRRVAVVNDGTSYGRLLAGGFTAESAARKVSRPVVRTLSVPPSLSAAAAAARRSRVAAAIKRADVDVVFFGGSSGQAAAFAESLREARVRVPLMGGDALLDGRFLTAAGALTATGDLAVFPGAAPGELATARGFLKRFEAAGFGTDPGPYGANAYDAARALLRAFGTAVSQAPAPGPTGEPTQPVTDALRADVVQALDDQRFLGATGQVRFDSFGDAINLPLSLYRYSGTKWKVVGVVRLG